MAEAYFIGASGFILLALWTGMLLAVKQAN